MPVKVHIGIVLFIGFIHTMGLIGCGESNPEAIDGEWDVGVGAGKADGSSFTECEFLEMLKYVNRPNLSARILRANGLNSLAAKSIISFRLGPDGKMGTGDDRLFTTIEELDAVPYIGKIAFRQLANIVASRCVQDVTTEDTTVEVLFNDPECAQPGCDQTGGTLNATLQMIREAKKSIDLAVFGLNEISIIDALCQAKNQRGIEVRVVSDQSTFHNDFDPPEGLISDATAISRLADCGIQVVEVVVSGLMHHKFYLIDAAMEFPTLLVGSQNQTYSCYRENHNNVILMHNPPPNIVNAYLGVFENMFQTHSCRGVAPHEQFNVGDSSFEIFFSPSGKTMRKLRGAMVELLVQGESNPYPEDPYTVCRKSYSSTNWFNWTCTFCALDENEYGLIGTAQKRVYLSIFHLTDVCTAQAVEKALERNPALEVMIIWDLAGANHPFGVDELFCNKEQTKLYVAPWPGDGYSSFENAKNHNKVFVIDDTVVTGSMNYSESGDLQNCETTLFIKSPTIAGKYITYLHSEIETLTTRMAVAPEEIGRCRCLDGLDNNGNGLTDWEEISCMISEGFDESQESLSNPQTHETCLIERLFQWVNDPTTTVTVLRQVGLDIRSANKIIAHRDGVDLAAGTSDDDFFSSLRELTQLPLSQLVMDKLFAAVSSLCE